MENRNDMNICGVGSLNGGEYNNINVSGAGTLKGEVSCNSLHCSGSVSAHGSIKCAKKIHIAGAFSCDSNIDVDEKISVSGSSSISGYLRGGRIHVAGKMTVHGPIYGEELVSAGNLTAKDNVECETIRLSGGCSILGNLNGENITLNMESAKMRIASIGGAQITVKGVRQNSNIFVRLFGREGGALISDLIEGDTITLTNTQCKIVRGKNVTIKGNSTIDRVEYSESLTVEPSATVAASEKI